MPLHLIHSVELQQEQTTIRRFCKPYNVLNGLGEFVEQKI